LFFASGLTGYKYPYCIPIPLRMARPFALFHDHFLVSVICASTETAEMSFCAGRGV